MAEPDGSGHLFGLLAATSTKAAPFRGRRDELAWLEQWWDDRGQPVAAVTGPPGTGKTRVVTQFAAGIGAPWTVGWLRDHAATEALAAVRAGRTPALVLVDEADERTDLAELAATLLGNGAVGGPPVRAVMIGRDPGLGRQLSTLGSAQASVAELRLGPFGAAGDRARWFTEAVTAYAAALVRRPPSVPDPLAGDVTNPDTHIIALHAQALVAVVTPEVLPGPGTRWDGLPFAHAAEALFAHELPRWQAVARELGPGVPDLAERFGAQALAALLLTAPADPDRAADALRHVPGLAEAPAEWLADLTRWAARLYPGGPARLVRLRPRALCDWFIVRHATREPALASALSQLPSARRLGLLAWASDYVPEAVELFKYAVAADPLQLIGTGAKAVAAAAPVTSAGRERLDEALADQVRRTEYPAAHLREVTDELTELLPRTRAAVAAAQVRHARGLDDPVVLAVAQDEAGARLAALGRFADALAAAEESAGLWHGIARDDPAQRPGLATALGTFAHCLTALRRPLEAELPAREATGLWHDLARDDPAHRPGLAAALGTLADCMQHQARGAEGLPLAEESVALWRNLARDDPAHRPGLAAALDTLAECGYAPTDMIRTADDGRLLSARPGAQRRDQKGLPGAMESVALWRELARESEAHRNGLALALRHLANNLNGADRTGEAIAIAREAADIWRQLDSPASAAELAGTLNDLGVRLGAVLHRHREALLALRESVEVWRQVVPGIPGQRHSLAHALQNLGNVLDLLDRPDESEQADIEATHVLVELVLEPNGSDYLPWLAAVTSNRARRLAKRGRYAAATTISRRAIGYWQVLAADDPSFIPDLQEQRSRLAEYEALDEEAGDGREQDPAADHARPQGAEAGERELGADVAELAVQGDQSFARGDYRSALAQLFRVMTLRESVQGPRHRDTLRARAKFANCLGKIGDRGEAVRSLTELLGDQSRHLGPDDPDVLSTRAELAFWTGTTGDTDGALRLYSQLLPDATRVLGDDDRQILAIQAGIAEHTGRSGDIREAMRLFTELLPRQLQALGPDHPATLETRNRIAGLTSRLGRPAEAAELSRALQADYARVLGEDHPDVLENRVQTAYATRKSGDLPGALRMYTDLLPDYVRVLGDWTQMTARVKNEIISLRNEIEEGSRAAGAGTAREVASRERDATEAERKGVNPEPNDGAPDVGATSHGRLGDAATPPSASPLPWGADLLGELPAHATAGDAAPAPDPGRSWAMLADLAASMGDLDGAVTAMTAAADATAPSDPDRCYRLSNLGVLLSRRHDLTASRADLDGSVTAGHAAVNGALPGDPGLPVYQSNLAAALTTRFKVARARQDIDTAVALLEEAVARTSDAMPGTDDGPGRCENAALLLSGLSQTLQERFEGVGDPADLNRAIETGKAAVEADPASTAALMILGRAHGSVFLRTTDLADLDEAVRLARAAVDATPTGHAARAGYLGNLGNLLRTRFEHTGAEADIDEAIRNGQAAVDATPAESPWRAAMLGNLALSRRVRFDHSKSAGDLDAAVEEARAAVSAAPDAGAASPVLLTNLSMSLLHRFDQAQDPADLADAVAAARAAVDLTPADSPHHPGRQVNLALAVRRQSQTRSDPADALPDLDEAVELMRSALAHIATDHSYRAPFLLDLGGMLTERADKARTSAGRLADQDAALSAYREAVQLVSARPSLRVEAARKAARLVADADRPAAAALLKTAVELLLLVAPRRLARGDQEQALGRYADLAADAVGLTVPLGRRVWPAEAAQALSLLETGRAVLMSQTLDARDDLTDLRALRPDLAERFATLRDRLDQPEQWQGAVPHGQPELSGRLESDEGNDRARLADQFAATVAEIRTQTGFTSFGRPPTVDELRLQAAEGPVVTLTADRLGGLALLLTRKGVSARRLPGLTRDVAASQARAFHRNVEIVSSPDSDIRDRRAAQLRLHKILEWLWDAVAEPVLDELGYHREPAQGAVWPRLWWVPCGPLALLPVHAAGYHTEPGAGDRSRRTVMDRVVSSYTPTIRALRYARRPKSAAGARGRPLIVAMPVTPGLPEADLPLVPTEVERVREFLPDAVLLAEPDGSGWPAEGSAGLPTGENVIDGLRDCGIVHFACHAASDTAAPSRSLLLLHDHASAPLTVARLAPVDLRQARLAYLSACRTAFTGVGLADEVIHLGSAFELAGFSQVVGTLWGIDDTAALGITEGFYTRLRSGATLNVTNAARALHSVTRAQRNKYPNAPALWAGHIHAGA